MIFAILIIVAILALPLVVFKKYLATASKIQ